MPHAHRHDERIVLLTFTPLEGMSEVVMGFLPEEMRPGEETV